MAALNDRVIYYTPETEEKPSEPMSAIITGFEEDGTVLFVMGKKTIGSVTAPESESPTPGCWVAIV